MDRGAPRGGDAVARVLDPDVELDGRVRVVAPLTRHAPLDGDRVAEQVRPPHLEAEPLHESGVARPIGHQPAERASDETRVDEDVRVAAFPRERPIVVHGIEVLSARDLKRHAGHRERKREAIQDVADGDVLPAALRVTHERFLPPIGEP